MSDLAHAIKKKVPDAKVTGKIGRRSSFEVTVNGKVAFSKLEVGGFPDTEEVVEMVKDVSQGGQMKKLMKKRNECILL
ncbi:hypothetical protein UPYG_G00088610 [Umbra pygmaea]|uniref:Uncharacterized protein n=1 Tax=Umbra pygmaea TaxID=75934 RepID=A0ABD0XFK6_UMBPY